MRFTRITVEPDKMGGDALYSGVTNSCGISGRDGS